MDRPYATTRTNEEVRKRSGDEMSQSRLVSFLYLLVRDHLSAGVVEEAVTEAVNGCGLDSTCHYTNGYLARYAKDLALALDPPDAIDCMVAEDLPLSAGFVQAELKIEGGGIPLSSPSVIRKRKEKNG